MLVERGYRCVACGRHFAEGHGHPVACSEDRDYVGRRAGRYRIREATHAVL